MVYVGDSSVDHEAEGVSPRAWPTQGSPHIWLCPSTLQLHMVLEMRVVDIGVPWPWGAFGKVGSQARVVGRGLCPVFGSCAQSWDS